MYSLVYHMHQKLYFCIFDRCVLYLKLFVGMGFIWITEIIQGLTTDKADRWKWYVTFNFCIPKHFVTKHFHDHTNYCTSPF